MATRRHRSCPDRLLLRMVLAVGSVLLLLALLVPAAGRAAEQGRPVPLRGIEMVAAATCCHADHHPGPCKDHDGSARHHHHCATGAGCPSCVAHDGTTGLGSRLQPSSPTTFLPEGSLGRIVAPDLRPPIAASSHG